MIQTVSTGQNLAFKLPRALARAVGSAREPAAGNGAEGWQRSPRSSPRPHGVPVDPSAFRCRPGPLNPPEWAQQAIEQQPWRGGLEPCGEHDYTLSPSNPAHVIGTIPEALQGTRCHRAAAMEGGVGAVWGARLHTLPSNPAHITGGYQRRCRARCTAVDRGGFVWAGPSSVYALHLDGPNGTARFVCKWVRTSALEQRGGPELEAGEGKGEDTGIRVKGAWTQATAGGLLKNVGLPANPVNTRGSREGKGKSTGIRVKGAWTQATGGGPLKNVGLPAIPVNTRKAAGAVCGRPAIPPNPLLLSLSPAYLSSHPPTSIIHFAGKLLALCEGGPHSSWTHNHPPIQRAAERVSSVDTIRPFSFPNLALPFFCAHPKLDPASGELYNFGSVLFGMQPFAIAADGQHTRMGALQGSPEVALVLPTRPNPIPLLPSKTVPTPVLFGMQPFAIAADGQHTRMGALQGSPEVALVHDCAMSSRFLVFTIPPYAASAGDVAQMPAGQQSLGNRLTYDVSPCIPTIHHPTILMLAGKQSLGNRFTYDESKPTRVVVVGKESLSVEVQMDVWPPFSNYHFCNAYEDGNKLHVLLTVLDGPRDGLEGVFKDMYGESWQRNNQCSVWELVIDTTPGTFSPAAEPCTPNLAREKYDLKTKQVTTHVTPPGCYVNECSFIPNSGTDNEDASKEDEGYLAAFVYDAARHRSHVVVLDARDVAAAPVAVVHLQSHVPFHFHGTWAGKATML
ncbi:unnamed protein product [Closterium sp. NIES-64]|nr:unnamed protein product [Closterium sp. NIES-64]